MHISVKKKVQLNELSPLEVIPEKFLGIKTDIVEDEELKIFSGANSSIIAEDNVNLNTKIRLVRLGSSIAPSGKRYSGTLGCIVFSNTNNKVYALSCNHVLADNNKFKKAHLILQPAPIYGGNSFDNVIGLLSDYIEIKFGVEVNYFDAAIAKIIKEYNVDFHI